MADVDEAVSESLAHIQTAREELGRFVTSVATDGASAEAFEQFTRCALALGMATSTLEPFAPRPVAKLERITRSGGRDG